MDLIKLIIKGISFNQMQEGIYALFLEEESSKAKIPIIINGVEAQSIALALKGKDTKEKTQNFTHSLIVESFKLFDIFLNKVIIYKLEDGIFFSYLICHGEDKKKQITSRISDAITLAIYTNAPVYMTREVFKKSFIPLDKEGLWEKEGEKDIRRFKDFFNEPRKVNDGASLINMSMDDLNLLLEQAIKDEYYEFAVLIKEEIDKREKFE